VKTKIFSLKEKQNRTEQCSRARGRQLIQVEGNSSLEREAELRRQLIQVEENLLLKEKQNLSSGR
jgi:hypothetical protein